MMTAHQTGTALNCHNLRSRSRYLEEKPLKHNRFDSYRVPRHRNVANWLKIVRDFVIHGWEPPSIQPWR
ncbi:hypothetical protein TNCV_1755572 [Trichonephila clavipes]|nr:hypothetical protein TNCV_1755572 [Trichonephila clavipes]